MIIDFKSFIMWEKTSKDTIDFKKIYVDMADDLNAGLLLSQIVYWHLPSKEGKQKLTVVKDDKLWLRKARDEWHDEIRLSPKQYDRAAKILEQKGLIERKNFRFNNSQTCHVRILWRGFLRALEEQLNQESNKTDQEMIDLYEYIEKELRADEPYSPNEIPQTGTSPSPSGNMVSTDGEHDIPEKGISTITENKAKNPSEITDKDHNLNHEKEETLNIYDYLWNSAIPKKIKMRIKTLLVSNEIKLSIKQIIQIENAYLHHARLGNIHPDAGDLDLYALNDDEFMITLEKMLLTVETIENMQGLIKSWISNGLEIKRSNAEDRFESERADQIDSDDLFAESYERIKRDGLLDRDNK